MTKGFHPCRAQDLVPSVSGSTLFRRGAPPSPEKLRSQVLLMLGSPLLAAKAGVAFRNPNSIPEKNKNPMYLNRVTLVGFTGRDPKTNATPGGKNITRLSVATTKRYKDGHDQWQEMTQWHSCVAFSGTADFCAKLQTGAHVFIEGEINYREYARTIETDSGPVKVQWPVTEVVIETVKLLDRNAEKGAAA